VAKYPNWGDGNVIADDASGATGTAASLDYVWYYNSAFYFAPYDTGRAHAIFSMMSGDVDMTRVTNYSNGIITFVPRPIFSTGADFTAIAAPAAPAAGYNRVYATNAAGGPALMTKTSVSSGTFTTAP
jgi:hypothetical protein